MADLFHKFQAGDAETLAKLQDLTYAMSLEELQRFCEGTMNAIIVAQDTFQKRFPREYAEWDAQFDD